MFYYMRYGVTIHRLVSNVRNREWFSKNDFFVIIKYKNQSRRTSVVWNSNEPVWEEGFILDVNIEDDDPIILTICDEDVYSKSECLIEDMLPINFNKERQDSTGHLSITHGILNYELMEKNVTLTRQIEKYELECSIMKKKCTDLGSAINSIGELQKKCNTIINKE